MTNLTFSLSLAATSVEMAACLICTRNLWRLQRETYDRSRRVLSLGSLISGVMALLVVMANIGMSVQELPYFLLQPWVCLVYMSLNIVMVLYPVAVVKPEWLTPLRFTYLFLPTLILAFVYLSFTYKWTLLSSTADIWANIGQPDVIARLASLVIMIPYCFILLMLPYNYRNSSASKSWIVYYTLGVFAICLTHIALMLTNNGILLIILPLMVSTFYVFSTEYELKDRLRPDGKTADVTPEPEPSAALESDLWVRVCRLMDTEEVWKDPDLSMSSLSRLCVTNVTYLSRIIQQETGHGFKELVNAKRVASVAAQLRENPDIDIQSAFFNAGFRSRTTAWRNFKEITGKTPADYRQDLKV